MRLAVWFGRLLVVAIAAVLVTAPRAEAGDEKPAAWEKVTLQPEKVRDDRGGSLVLTSATEMELDIGGGARTQGTWSLVRGPSIRCVVPREPGSKSGLVFTFRLTESGAYVAESSPDERLRVTTGKTWHAKARADAALAGEPERYEAYGARSFVLHGGNVADYELDEGMVPATAERKGDTLIVRPGDGSSWTFRRDGDDWVIPETGQLFAGNAERAARKQCIENLAQLIAVFVVERTEKPGKPKYDGISLLLAWRVKGAKIKTGQEAVLRCPRDPSLAPLDDAGRKAYDEADLKAPRLDLCSYAGRDFASFPLPAESMEPQPIFACRQGKDGRTPHHKGGACVAFDDGRAVFMTREDLGLEPADPIVVGPGSKSPVLKVLCQIPKR